MVFKPRPEPYSEDIFSDSRMSFGEHIEDLRSHLLRAIYGFLIALLLSFAIGSYVLEYIARPVNLALEQYWQRYDANRVQQVLRDLDEGDPTLMEYNKDVELSVSLPRSVVHPDKAEPTQGEELIKTKMILHEPLRFIALTKKYEPFLGRRPTLSTLRVEEGFMVYFKVCMVTAFVLASPWVFYQLWSFVAAGLYPNEKRYVNVFMPFSIGLFIAGVVLCEVAVLPKAVEALLWFNEWLGFQPELRLNDWLGFAIIMPLIFGLTFQTPLVMLFAERVGFLTIDTMRRNRKIAWFVMAIFAALITPSPDAFSMILLWLPMSLLYELGIILCRMQPPHQTFDEGESDTGAMVEV